MEIGSKIEIKEPTSAEKAEFEMWWSTVIAGKTPHYKYLARKAWFDSRKYAMGVKRFQLPENIVVSNVDENKTLDE